MAAIPIVPTVTGYVAGASYTNTVKYVLDGKLLGCHNAALAAREGLDPLFANCYSGIIEQRLYKPATEEYASRAESQVVEGLLGGALSSWQKIVYKDQEDDSLDMDKEMAVDNRLYQTVTMQARLPYHLREDPEFSEDDSPLQLSYRVVSLLLPLFPLRKTVLERLGADSSVNCRCVLQVEANVQTSAWTELLQGVKVGCFILDPPMGLKKDTPRWSLRDIMTTVNVIDVTFKNEFSIILYSMYSMAQVQEALEEETMSDGSRLTVSRFVMVKVSFFCLSSYHHF